MSSDGTTGAVTTHPVGSASPPLSTSWRNYAISPWEWEEDEVANQAGAQMAPQGNEGGGFFVRSETLLGCRAYLKPLKKCQSTAHVRAAREKIVSDLAQELGVPVPEVLLIERRDNIDQEEAYACVSKVMTPRQWSWGQVKRFVVDPQSDANARVPLMMALPRDAAAGIALDAWVDQVDHNDHPHNIVFGYTPGHAHQGKFLFLDFAWALGYPQTVLSEARPDGWRKKAWNSTRLPPFPPDMASSIDTVALDAIVDRIEAFPDAKIEGIVRRIPETFMIREEQEVIVEGLVGRRSLVRSILAPLRRTA